MRIKRKIAVALAACALAGVSVFGIAAPASAMSQWQFDQACKWKYNEAGAHAVSGGNAYQWQCWNLSVQLGGLDLYGYCRQVEGMNNVQLVNVNDKFSWKCV